MGLGKSCLSGEVLMNAERLQKCIESLKELRERTRETVEVGVVEELDEVIDQLEQLREKAGEGRVEVDAKLRSRAMEYIDYGLRASTNIVQLIKLYFDAQ